MDSNTGGFEGAFDSFKREIDPKSLRKLLRTIVFLVVAVMVVVFTLAAITPWTEYMWFLHDVRYPEVFRVGYAVRGSLFSSAFIVAWVCLYFNVRKAFKLTLVFIEAPTSAGQKIVTSAISYLQVKGATIIRFVAPVLAFFSAIDFANESNTYLLASHAQHFGVADPTYGLDLGFYVFTLPWYRAMANFGCGLLVLTTLATIGVYLGIQGLAAIAKVELGRPAVRKHVHCLIAITILALALQLFLRTFEAGLTANTQFTGAGLSDNFGYMMQRWLVVVAVVLALASAANGWVGQAFRIPIAGGIAWFVLYVLGTGIVPAGIERFYVDSNRLEREAPFASRAIKMTRFAYGLDHIEVKAQDPSNVPSPAEVTASKPTLDNMRLWDPKVLQTCLEVYQGIRTYYKFYDVDVDRYNVAGKQTLLMLSPREMDLNGLLPNAQTWTSERLLYTHGYGVAVARVDKATTEGEPVLLDEDIPERYNKDLAVTEPRIYFGDQHDEMSRPVDEYAVVNTKQPEFDYPTSDSDAQIKWLGDRGIPVGSLLNRLAYSVILGDINMLLSSSITSESRLLMHRNVLERATRVYPYLKFDADPYIFLSKGRVFWILDGYTTSDMVPYSSMSEGGAAKLNYIRNSVKVVVDAYSGEITAYSVDDNEPILKAWREIYPGTVHSSSEVPPDVAAHFRYPEDLLNLQSSELCFYHVENPSVFLGNGDLWSIAAQRGRQGDRETIRPFYVEMKLPDRQQAEFVQILPFSPSGRPTMTGWLAAHCDPGVYGQLTLYKLSQSNPISGPEQVEGAFSTTPEIANINKQFQNQNSNIVVGNLLVIPIGNSFMYAESLFLQSNTQELQSVPRLAKVILALNGRTPVVADTYQEALSELFGNAREAPVNLGNPTSAPPPGAITTHSGPVDVTQIKKVLDLLDKADAALKQGDFAGYGALQKRAREQLKSLTVSNPAH